MLGPIKILLFWTWPYIWYFVETTNMLRKRPNMYPSALITQITFIFRSVKIVLMNMTKITVTSKRTTELSMKDQEQNFSQQEPGETAMKNACKLTRDQDLWSNLATLYLLIIISRDRGMDCHAASYVRLRFNSMCWIFNEVTVSNYFKRLIHDPRIVGKGGWKYHEVRKFFSPWNVPTKRYFI